MVPERHPHPDESSAGALDVVALACLREAAALVHTEPAVRVRLRDGHRILATVAARSPLDERPARWLAPCAFRGAVADAWAMAQVGRPVGMTGLLGAGPAIDVGLPAGGRTWAHGVHRWSDADRRAWRWAVAMTGDAATCRDQCEAMADDPRTELLGEVRLRADPLLDCCVLRATSQVDPAGEEVVAGLLGDVVVGHAVSRLVAAGSAQPG